jgi:hypothetical protein
MPSAARAFEGTFVHAFRQFESALAGEVVEGRRRSDPRCLTLQYSEYAQLVRQWAFGVYNTQPIRHRLSSGKSMSRLAASAADHEIVRLVDPWALSTLLNPADRLIRGDASTEKQTPAKDVVGRPSEGRRLFQMKET